MEFDKIANANFRVVPLLGTELPRNKEAVGSIMQLWKLTIFKVVAVGLRIYVHEADIMYCMLFSRSRIILLLLSADTEAAKLPAPVSIPEDLGITNTVDIVEDRNLTMMLDPREWTDQEVLRLMQGVEKYKDDWNKVWVTL